MQGALRQSETLDHLCDTFEARPGLATIEMFDDGTVRSRQGTSQIRKYIRE